MDHPISLYGRSLNLKVASFEGTGVGVAVERAALQSDGEGVSRLNARLAQIGYISRERAFLRGQSTVLWPVLSLEIGDARAISFSSEKLSNFPTVKPRENGKRLLRIRGDPTMDPDSYTSYFLGIVVVLKLSIEKPRTLDGLREARDIELSSFARPVDAKRRLLRGGQKIGRPEIAPSVEAGASGGDQGEQEKGCRRGHDPAQALPRASLPSHGSLFLPYHSLQLFLKGSVLLA